MEKLIRSNKELKIGQIITAEVYKGQMNQVAVVEPVSGGYSKVLVKDCDPDQEIITTKNQCYAKRIRRNHARGAEYIIHISQIKKLGI